MFNSSAALVHSQLVCLLPVRILNLLSVFQLLVSLALKSPSGEWSITYVCCKTAVYEVGLVKAVGFYKDGLGPILPSTFTWVELVGFLLYSDRFLPGYYYISQIVRAL